MSMSIVQSMTSRMAAIVVLLLSGATSAVASEFLIQGKIKAMAWNAAVDAEASAPRLAHVYLSNGPLVDAFVREEVADDGSFSLRTNTAGPVNLYVSAAGYQTLETLLLLGAEDISDTISVNVRLARTNIPGELEAFLLRPIGSQGNLQRAIEIVPDKHGRFKAEVELDPDQEVLSYRMAGIARDANGQRTSFVWTDLGADRLELEHGGFYRAHRAPTDDSSRTVSFSWSMPRSQADIPRMEFDDKLTGLFTVIAQGIRKDRPFDSLVTHLAKDPRSAILAERRAPIRRVLLLAYLAGVKAGNLQADEITTRMAYRDIAPSSVLWSLQPALLWNAWYQQNDSAENAAYIQRVYNQHPLSDVRAYILYRRIKESSDDAEREDLLNVLRSKFPESVYLDLSLVKFVSGGPLTAGSIIPDFEMRDLDSLDQIFTPESMRGNVFILDFWSTWCRECVDGIKNLRQAHSLYADYGLRIISVAFEPNAGNVRKFHRQVAPMPWFNVLEKNGPQSEIARLFEIRGIPLTVLVDEDGRVIASGKELRNGRLLSLLADIFADRMDE